MPNENPNEGESNRLDALLKARAELIELEIPPSVVGKDGEKLRAAQESFRLSLNALLAKFDYMGDLPQELFGRDTNTGKSNMNQNLNIEEMIRGVDALIDKMSKKKEMEIYHMPVSDVMKQLHDNLQDVFRSKKKKSPSSTETISVKFEPVQEESGSSAEDAAKVGEIKNRPENASNTPQEGRSTDVAAAAVTSGPEKVPVERIQAFSAKRFEMWLQREGRFSPVWKRVKGTFVDFERWANDWWEFMAKTQLGQWLDAFTGIAEPKHKNFLLSNKKNKK